METCMNAEQLAEKLILWIKDEVLAAGRKGVVVGMSGGLDSSVLAVLCYRALPQSMLGVLIPTSKGSPVVTLLEEVFMRMFVIHALAVPLP